MSSTTTTTTEEHIELSSLPEPFPAASGSTTAITEANVNAAIPPDDAANLSTAIPDGGYGWTIVFCGALISFWNSGVNSTWGVLQAAMLNSTLPTTSVSTLAWVGSLGMGCAAASGLLVTRAIRLFGSRPVAIVGTLLMGLSLIGAGLCTSNVLGLFGTAGFLLGVGMGSVYTVNNALPMQYFSGRLGLANGLIKFGGGLGGCVLAIALDALNRRVGVKRTFIVEGLLVLATGLPAAYLLKDRVRQRNTPFVDLSMFRSLAFVTIFASAAIGTFSLFVPPFFLPLFAQSIGLSSSTGAGIVAAFNACNAMGRFGAGPLCDKLGPVNSFFLTMVLNAISMLAIWSVSNTVGPLILFAMLNGVANGSFFTTIPIVVADMFGPGRASIAMSMTCSGFTGGYLMGAPVAGYLLQAAGGNPEEKMGVQGIDVYRPAIFYAGGVATVSSLLVLVARVKLGGKVLKKV